MQGGVPPSQELLFNNSDYDNRLQIRKPKAPTRSSLYSADNELPNGMHAGQESAEKIRRSELNKGQKSMPSEPEDAKE